MTLNMLGPPCLKQPHLSKKLALPLFSVVEVQTLKINSQEEQCYLNSHFL